MTAVQATAIVLWLGITAYAVFGGADFGAGFWDLAAGRTAPGLRPRALIADAIGPVWEANHTWLIFDLVILWTAFPPAFAAIMSTLFVPLSLAGLGIVLRGAAFAFRPQATGLRGRRAAGAIFAISSVVTPFFLGAVAGAIASGRVLAAAAGPRRPVVGLAQPDVAPARRAGRRRLRLPRGRLPRRRCAAAARRRAGRLLPAAGDRRGGRGRRPGDRRDRRPGRRRPGPRRRADQPGLAAPRRVRGARDRGPRRSCRGTRRAAPAPARSGRSSAVVGAGASPSTRTSSRRR